MSIYKGDKKVTGTGVQIDTALSSDSNNAVTNAAITNALTDVGYSEWQKPDDWIDIRSAALPDSVYFLVGHSVPVLSEGTYSVATYPQIAFYAEVSNSGTYDVYVDGVKIATTANGTATTITWADLYNAGTILGGYEVTYPSALTTHVVRITPSVSTNNLTQLKHYALSNNIEYGTLWEHFTTTSALDINRLNFGNSWSAICKTYLLEAVTSMDNELAVSNMELAFWEIGSSLKTVPVFNCSFGSNAYLTEAFKNCTSLKEVTIKNFTAKELGGGMFDGCSNLQKVNITPCLNSANGQFRNCAKLKELPALKVPNGTLPQTNFFQGCLNLNPFVLDYANAQTTRFGMGGTSTARIDGIKGLTVSPEAPFDNATSPQLDVSYTGLSRAALVNLFKSMPYNVGYTVVGTPTITDGVASGFGQDTGIIINSSISQSQSFELVIKATNSSTQGQARVIYSSDYNMQLTTINGYWILQFNGGGSTWGDAISDIPYIKIIKSGNTAAMYQSADGISYTLKADNIDIGTLTDISGFTFGMSGAPLTDGTINLNETYIKVDGVPFFGPGVTKNLVPGGTVVGSPTITNGVASGFSNSKYITPLSEFNPGNSTWEIGCKFTTGTSKKDAAIYAFSRSSASSNYRYGTMFRTTGNGKFELNFSLDGNSWFSSTYTDFIFAISTTYWTKEYWDGSSFKLDISTDGITYQNIANIESAIPIYSPSTQCQIGAWMYGVDGWGWNGSIDLNNTYIKVGNNYIYRGMVPQVKTCSVVGCTGTADLTAEDKAIATGKGWELTVA